MTGPSSDDSSRADSLVQEGPLKRKQTPVVLVPGFRSMQIKQRDTAYALSLLGHE